MFLFCEAYIVYILLQVLDKLNTPSVENKVKHGYDENIRCFNLNINSFSERKYYDLVQL